MIGVRGFRSIFVRQSRRERADTGTYDESARTIEREAQKEAREARQKAMLDDPRGAFAPGSNRKAKIGHCTTCHHRWQFHQDDDSCDDCDRELGPCSARAVEA